jgi:DNA-binding XRE family transcriptional regulator
LIRIKKPDEIQVMSPREIRRLRGQLGLTQSQFGMLIHAHPGTVSRWERGTMSPDEWQLALLTQMHRSSSARPETADRALELLGAGLIAAALGVLLGATVFGVAQAMGGSD